MKLESGVEPVYQKLLLFSENWTLLDGELSVEFLRQSSETVPQVRLRLFDGAWYARPAPFDFIGDTFSGTDGNYQQRDPHSESVVEETFSANDSMSFTTRLAGARML